MAYNDGWRVYEPIQVQTERRMILMIAKTTIEQQLSKQQGIVRVITEKAKEVPLNVSQRVKSRSIGKLQNECEQRDRLSRRLDIVNQWIIEVEK